MITIQNAKQPQHIETTNFWKSDFAEDGLCFLSWNAGAARLLMPDSRKSYLEDMRAATRLI